MSAEPDRPVNKDRQPLPLRLAPKDWASGRRGDSSPWAGEGPRPEGRGKGLWKGRRLAVAAPDGGIAPVGAQLER